MRSRGTRTPHRGGTVRDRGQRHTGAEDLGGARHRVGDHVAEPRHQPRGRHRLPQGHDRRADRSLLGGDRELAGHPGGVRSASRRRHRRRRARHRAGGARSGGTAVLRHRRRRLSAVLRRRVRLGAGLRRPRGGSRRGDGELPALDLRHRPHRTETRRAGLRTVHRGARHRPDAARRAHRSTARPHGASCSIPQSNWPTAASTSARGWPPPSPTPQRNCASTRRPPHTSSIPTEAQRHPGLG